MEDIISGNIDIYAELQLNRDASSAEISRAYRKKALLYHPDKNKSPEATQKFHLLTIINDILSDPDLRARYDALRSSPSTTSEGIRSAHANEFREKLQKAEAAHQRQKHRPKQLNVQKLEMEGLRLRYEYQLRHSTQSEYVSFRDLDSPQFISTLSIPTVVVKWKQKSDAQIDEPVLTEIMSIFGPVDHVTLGEYDGRYATGTVTYCHAHDASTAAQHNYKSASLWDGKKVRKLASLLRGCTVADPALDM